MPDVEFLPEWYAGLRTRKRWLKLQLALTLALAVGVGLWAVLVQRNQRASEAALVVLKGQLQQTGEQIKYMERQEILRKQWRRQAEVLEKMGLHVASSQMIARLSEALPQSVSLLGMGFEVEETPVAISAAQKAAMKDPSAPVVERKMKIRLQGVAPTDLELATFLADLNKTPFFDHVAPTYVRDRRESAHILREFEVTFIVGLSNGLGS